MNKEKIDYKKEFWDRWILAFVREKVSTLPPEDCECPRCMKRKSESSNRL